MRNQDREMCAIGWPSARISNFLSRMLPTASSWLPSARSTTDRWCSGETSDLRTVATTWSSCSISIVSRIAISFLRTVTRMWPEVSLSSKVCRSRSALPSTRNTWSPWASVIKKSSPMEKIFSRTAYRATPRSSRPPVGFSAPSLAAPGPLARGRARGVPGPVGAGDRAHRPGRGELLAGAVGPDVVARGDVEPQHRARVVAGLGGLPLLEPGPVAPAQHHPVRLDQVHVVQVGQAQVGQDAVRHPFERPVRPGLHGRRERVEVGGRVAY